MPYIRKNIRLPAEHYLGARCYFVTLCCDRRRPYLSVPSTARTVLDLLFECSARHSFLLHAFCLMPDHLHLLAEGTHPRSDLLEFIRLFKQRTAFAFRKIRPAHLWEMSFYDYVLRPSDTIEDVACYIWWNPVRRKLCADPRDFLFSGSQTIDWMQDAPSPRSWCAPWKTKDQSKEPV